MKQVFLHSMSSIKFFLVANIIVAFHFGNAYESLECLVCRAAAEEIDYAIKNMNPAKKVQVGSYRIDAQGNQYQVEIPYARSELHLQELMESLCEKMGSEYTRVTHKETGEESLFRFLDKSGKMNPDFSKYDVVPNNDLERNIKFQCETVIEASEEHIISVFKQDTTDSPAEEICWNLTGYCGYYDDEEREHEEL